MAFTATEINVIMSCYYGTSFLNFLGALFTVTTYVAFKGVRNEGTALIFFLSASDLMQSSAAAWGVFVQGRNNIFCQVQATMIMFGLVASMAWSLVIGFYLFLVLYKNLDFEKLEKYKVLFHFFVWGYAAGASFATLAAGGYGPDFPSKYSWCWVAENQSNFRLLFYIPDSTIYLILVIIYCVLQLHLSNTHNTSAIVICRKMRIYLLTYVLINTFAIVNRLQGYFLPQHQIFAMYVLQFLTQPSQGFFNAIAYAWNEPVFVDQYKRLFTKCTECTFSRKRPAIVTSTEEDRLINTVVYYDREP